MENEKTYSLPRLSYDYADLEPHMSADQLKLHHEKHHQAYVTAANGIFERLDKAREAGNDVDIRAIAKELSFNVNGHVLHSLFWENLAPAGEGGGGEPEGELRQAIEGEFGSFERFKKEFTMAAASVEGSGWAGLSLCPLTGRLLITQIEKHNFNLYVGPKLILVLDVFEHAYYVDYKNERAKFIEAFWNIVNWQKIEERI